MVRLVPRLGAKSTVGLACGCFCNPLRQRGTLLALSGSGCSADSVPGSGQLADTGPESGGHGSALMLDPSVLGLEAVND